MSPASSGSLEVEKYIGACLISQRPKGFLSRAPDTYSRGFFDGRYRRCNDRWAGGMPLISFANQRNRPEGSTSPKVDDQHTPLARLAVHTQGAPLILTKTFNRRSKVPKNVANRTFEGTNSKGKGPSKVETQNSVVDTVSVTSDESSGSGNSDNCLPRIIKPRKRRKKDRKPSLLGHPLNQDGFSTDSASPDIDTIPINILKPYTPFIFDPHLYGLVPESLPLINRANETQELFSEVSETPKLHHSFEDVEELDEGIDINGNQSTTVCQCRYCDPAGQIWDVDRNCYSPFLTAPIRGKSFHFDTFLPRYNSVSDNLEHSCLVHSMSSISLEEEKEQKIIDTKPSSSRDLEVSTEIVTSLNGHRDIEIKFFSSPSAESVRALPKSPDRILSNVEDVDKKLCVKQSCDSQNNVSVNNQCKFALSEE